MTARRSTETADADGQQRTEGLEPGATTEITNTENAAAAADDPQMVVDTVDGAAQPGGSTQSPADAARAAALAIRQKEVQEAMRNDTHKKVEAVSVDVVKLHATLAETVANQADVNGKVTSALEDLRATVLRLETFMMADKAKGNANDPRLNRLKDIAIQCLKSPLAALGKDKVAATVVELAAAESINPPTSVEEVLAHWAEIEDDATYKAVTSGAGASNANTPLKTPRSGRQVAGRHGFF
ncbi:hypothetical protein PLESTM_000066700 [Pleodorina starrii]|nr:hypothetical protein PLESTM_000066700 [Pleodorina starrii]